MTTNELMLEKDYELYIFLINYFKQNGYAPSYREISEGIGNKSISEVRRKLCKLQEIGKIEIKEGQPRAIRLVGYTFRKEIIK